MTTGIIGILKLAAASTGGTRQNNANACLVIVTGNRYFASVCASAIAAAVSEGEGSAWSSIDKASYDSLPNIQKAAFAYIGGSDTPAQFTVFQRVTDSGPADEAIIPAQPGARIGLLALGGAQFDYSVELDGTELTRAAIYQKLADHLITKGLAATVETVIDGGNNYSLLKIPAAAALGDKDVLLYTTPPGAMRYAFAIHAQKANNDATDSAADDCFFGQSEGKDDEWVFPKILGFFNQD